MTDTSAELPASSTPVHLLVVDDDPLSSSLEAHLASLLGHTAIIEADAERAVEMALTGEFDLMLLDLGMPRIDGFEALRRLREREMSAERTPLPVIAVTGYASESDRLRCLMAGFNEHLSKPVQAASLAAVIGRVMSGRYAGARNIGERSPAGAEPSGAVQESDAERLRATVRRLAGVKPGDRQFAPTVTESFALRSAQLIETLRQAVAEMDTEPALRAARAMKSSAEFLGALRLANMSAELDQRCAGGQWEAAAELLTRMDHEHQAVLTLLFESSR